LAHVKFVTQSLSYSKYILSGELETVFHAHAVYVPNSFLRMMIVHFYFPYLCMMEIIWISGNST